MDVTTLLLSMQLTLLLEYSLLLSQKKRGMSGMTPLLLHAKISRNELSLKKSSGQDSSHLFVEPILRMASMSMQSRLYQSLIPITMIERAC